MTHPPDGNRAPGPAAPVEPGSALHRLLVMVAEAIVRSRIQQSDEATASPAPKQPPSDTRSESLPAE